MNPSLLVLPLSLLAAAPAQDPVPPPAAEVPIAVHEWGTFTSFQGSDGLVLEGLHHEEEPLPGFVHDLADLVEIPQTAVRWGVKFPASHVTQKMETPVIYFHADVPLRAWVAVRFERGLLTQLYPMPTHIAPPLAELRAPVDMSTLKGSNAVWQVELSPAASRPPHVPEVARDDPWFESRQVRAAWVRNIDLPGRPQEAEQFIFYRGIGAFAMPVDVRDEGDGPALNNGAGAALPFAAALEIGDRGGRWRPLPAVAAGGSVGLGLDRLPFAPDVDQVVRELSDAVQKALEARGLFTDEARAMVATWSRSWFRTAGSRVLYIVPQAEVERVLPLTVMVEPMQRQTREVIVFEPPLDAEKVGIASAQPQLVRNMVRVLVGRVEFLTAERERGLVAALRRGDGLPVPPRFTEPVLRRVLQVCDDPAVRERAEAMLAGARR